MSRRLVVGPFNRVEGDLEVRLDIADGTVAQAFVSASMYRGFERMLAGKDPFDALAIAPRICGVCSVAQGTAAALALADAAGTAMPANGRLAVNILQAVENAAEHVTHFYTAFMPDVARDGYAGAAWHPHAVERFKAGRGTALNDAVPARAQLLHVMGLMAGKWPHTLAVQPGGTTRAIEEGERTRLLAIVAGFRRFLERTVFAASLKEILSLDSPQALWAWADKAPAETGDFRFFLQVARHTGMAGLGRFEGPLMSYGAYRAPDGAPLFAAGLWQAGTGATRAVDMAAVQEDLASSWLAGSAAEHPFEGRTEPAPEKAGAYTWAKAPRLDGQPVEVGAVARQCIDGQPLVTAMVSEHGASTVLSRVVARMIETARLVAALEAWIAAIDPAAPFFTPCEAPRSGRGVGLTEAARGGLGHWIEISGGRLVRYQVVSPTTWNFAPRDADGRPGPLETALAGTPVGAQERTPVAVQHVVRSFDPCMVCTVH